MHVRLGVRVPFAFLLLASCANDEKKGTIALVYGETEALTAPPAVTQLEVTRTGLDGATTTLAWVSLPTERIDLGDVPVPFTGRIDIQGWAGNTAVVRGRSITLPFESLDAQQLSIFVARTGRWSAMPSAFVDARAGGALFSIFDRYLFSVGGISDDPNIERQTKIFDLATFEALPTPPTLPRRPLSSAVSNGRLLLLDGNGADIFDLSTNSLRAAGSPPNGYAFGDVAGGSTVMGPDGSAYVVGATGRLQPSKAIVRLDPTGQLRWYSHNELRIEAASTWVKGRGLLVGGGNLSTGPGFEIVDVANNAVTALPYPDEHFEGGFAALTRADGHVWLIGGRRAPHNIRSMDPFCTNACDMRSYGSLSLRSVQAFEVENGAGDKDILAIGVDDNEAVNSFLIGPDHLTEARLPFVATEGRAALLPNGVVALRTRDHGILTFTK